VRSRRLRDLLIGAQVAFSLVLMIAGSMLIRSSLHALKMDTGYDDKHVVCLYTKFPDGFGFTPERKSGVLTILSSRLSGLPGVTAVASGRAPDGDGLQSAAISLNGEQPSPRNTRAFLYYNYVQPNYFQTLGIPLLFGRGFSSQSGRPESSVILSESAARRLWPGQNPIGRTLRMSTSGQFRFGDTLSPDGPTYQVIGIARDTRAITLNGDDTQQVYIPLAAGQFQGGTLLIRTQSDPAQLINRIGPLVASVDPAIMSTSSTLEEMLRQTPVFLISSLMATIASTVGLLGLVLASMGIYGTVSYMVVLRTREVGIRIALGAKRRDVLRLMLRESARPVLAGLVVGTCLAASTSHLMRGVLYGVSAIDGVSFGGVSLLFLAIALVATYLPSKRAMHVDPVVALRCE
jgi:predicted permease